MGAAHALALVLTGDPSSLLERNEVVSPTTYRLRHTGSDTQVSRITQPLWYACTASSNAS